MTIFKTICSIFSRTLLIACCVGVLSSNHFAQDASALAQSRQFEQQANAAYKGKDFAAFLSNIKQAAALRPNHPRLLYNLAKAFALNNNRAEAIKILSDLAAMGMTPRFAADEEFSAKFSAEDTKRLAQMFERNRQPLNRSARAFALPEKDLIAESIAFDAASNRFFVGSVHKGKILAIDSNGAASEFSKPEDNLWSVLGMKTDEKRRALWVCTAALPQFQNFQKTDEGASAVFKYDLNTGRLIKKYLVPKDAGKHALGDLVISRNGEVFATDSASPNIYRINPKTDRLEKFLSDESFASLQGLAFSGDEKHLFVADYAVGIFSVEMATKKITLLAAAGNAVALGIDGLYFHKGKLVAVQNGTNPHRVARFTLDRETARLAGVEILEANHADFNEPTLGVVVGNDFYFVANSQWGLINEEGKIAAPEKLSETVVLRLSL